LIKINDGQALLCLRIPVLGFETKPSRPTPARSKASFRAR